MARGLNLGTPAMALLATLAVAGFQHRDQLGRIASDLMGNKNRVPGGSDPDGSSAGSGGIGDLLAGLRGMLGGEASGASLSGGLGEVVDRFRESPVREAADSWVSTGPNQGLQPDQVEQAIGTDNLRELAKRTGLSREELLVRLAKRIPAAVNELTPDGRIPSADEASRYL
jgi:uncharacterized protein YidB (DUF937 family)